MTAELIDEDAPHGNQRVFIADVNFVRAREVQAAAAAVAHEAYFGGATMKNPSKLEVIEALTKAADEGNTLEIPVRIERVGLKTGTAAEPRFVIFETGGEGRRAGAIMGTDEPSTEDELDAWFDKHKSLPGKAVRVEEGKLVGSKGKVIAVTFVFEEVDTNQYLPMIDDAVAHGKGTEAELQEKLQYMLENEFSEENIKLVFSSMRRAGLPYSIKHPRTLFRTKGMNLKKAVIYACLGKNLLMYGPASGGKNTLIDTVDWLLNVPQIMISGSDNTDEDVLFGGLRLVNGETKVVIPKHIEMLSSTHGCDLVIDEADMIMAGVLAKAHSAMDYHRQIEIEGYGTIKVSPLSRFTFTVNKAYEGCKEMNRATKSRTVPLEILPEFSLAEIFEGRGFDGAKVAIAQQCMDEILRQSSQNILQDVEVYVRCVETALEAAEQLPLNDCLKDALAAQVDDTYSQGLVVGIVDTYCPLTI